MVPKKGADRTSRSDRKAHDNPANRARALSVYFPDFRTMTPVPQTLKQGASAFR